MKFKASEEVGENDAKLRCATRIVPLGQRVEGLARGVSENGNLIAAYSVDQPSTLDHSL